MAGSSFKARPAWAYWALLTACGVVGGAVGAILLWSLARANPDLTVLEIFQGLLTPLIAALAAYIAWQQWQTNVYRLRLDRYDRRLRIYKDVMAFIALVSRDFEPTFEEVLSFARETVEADFLFGEEVTTFINEV
jgi:H+/Cl- antiporter ClcA